MSLLDPGSSDIAISRIALRPLCTADETLYCGLYTDPETMRFIGPPLSRARAVRSFRSVMDDTECARGVFVILEKAEGAPVGICGWHAPDTARKQVEIGVLLNARGRNRRYSGEALAMVIDKAFSALPIHTVWAQYHEAHSAAERLFAGLGMQPGGLEIEDGTQPTQVVRSIHRSMWRRTGIGSDQGGRTTACRPDR